MDFYYKNFKSIRISQGLTHEDIANRLGISKQAVQAWESGKNKPRPSNIKKIAQILNCSVIDISDLPPEPQLMNVPDIILSDEDVEIIQYFHDQKNKLEKYELLAKIERSKKFTYKVEEESHEKLHAAEKRRKYNEDK